MRYSDLQKQDPELYKSLQGEISRQKDGLELIASENYVSSAVLDAMGSILTNKYSEGMVGKRYYGGNQYIDEIEALAVSRAKEIFGVDHVNVQPYSGSPANLAVYFGLLEPGDKVMGMKLDAGGHLTHGFKVSFSGKYYDAVNYGVDDNGYLDFNEIKEKALEEKPKLIWAGTSAYSREIDFMKFREIADEVGAVFAADIAHIAGLIAGGQHQSPVGIADIITTTTHKTLRGPRGAMIMCDEKYAKAIDKAVFPGLQGGPHNHTTAGIAVALGEVLEPEFKDYAKQVVVNAKRLAKGLSDMGYDLITGGTDTHLLLIDIIDKGLSGGEAEIALEKAGITVNKNVIPQETRKPSDPSGIRLGTAALTTRGMKEEEMDRVVEFIDRAIRNKDSDAELNEISSEIKSMVEVFPISGIV